MNRLAPGGCCEEQGCDIFDIQGLCGPAPTNVVDGSAADITQDAAGRHVVNARINDGGNWFITITYHDRDATEAPAYEFFLLRRSDDSILAKWSHDFGNAENAGQFWEDGGTYATEWADVNEWNELHSNWEWQLVVRPFGAYLSGMEIEFGRDPAWYPGFDPATKSTDYGSPSFPVPASALAEDVYFAAKRVNGTDANTLHVKAERLEVEADPRPEQDPPLTTETRAECEFPTACPVNYPSYTTPRFTVQSISGDYVPPSGDVGHRFYACRSDVYDFGPHKAHFDLLWEEIDPHTFTFSHSDYLGRNYYTFDGPGNYPILGDRTMWQAFIAAEASDDPSKIRLRVRLTLTGFWTFMDADDFEAVKGTDGPFHWEAARADWNEPPDQLLTGKRTTSDVSLVFEKDVDIWLDTPPVVTLDSAHLVSAPSGTSPRRIIESLSYSEAAWPLSDGTGGITGFITGFSVTVSGPIDWNSYSITLGPENLGYLPNL